LHGKNLRDKLEGGSRALAASEDRVRETCSERPREKWVRYSLLPGRGAYKRTSGRRKSWNRNSTVNRITQSRLARRRGGHQRRVPVVGGPGPILKCQDSGGT